MSQQLFSKPLVLRQSHLDATSSLAARGYCVLEDSLTVDQSVELLAEATAFESHALRASSNYYRVNADRSISSPRSLSTVTAGVVLKAIHHDEHRLALLDRLAGRRMSPTRRSYIYYQPGDYIGLHTDASVCNMTLITSITGTLDELVVHDALVGVPPEELLVTSRAHSAMPPGGSRVAIPRGRFLLLFGSRIPHHRPAALDFCTIATLCYA